jgi:hypothetical protein
MSKKRTRRNKINAKHQFSLTWSPEPKKDQNKLPVKGYSKNAKLIPISSKPQPKNAEITEKEPGSGSTKNKISKSLIVVSFILALEVVIYLVWH